MRRPFVHSVQTGMQAEWILARGMSHLMMNRQMQRSQITRCDLARHSSQQVQLRQQGSEHITSRGPDSHRHA